MEYWFFLIITLIVFLILFKVIVPDSEQTKEIFVVDSTDKNNDINITVNTDRYYDDYYNGYNNSYGCNSYNCRRRSYWYGNTPFIWNNGTRYPRWRRPYYAYVHDWYRDTYSYPIWNW